MKLKEAKKIAKEHGHECIAVDANLKIFSYYNKLIYLRDIEWKYDSSISRNNHKYIGQYTGSKHWTETMREVK